MPVRFRDAQQLAAECRCSCRGVVGAQIASDCPIHGYEFRAGGPEMAPCVCGHSIVRHDPETGCLAAECGCATWDDPEPLLDEPDAGDEEHATVAVFYRGFDHLNRRAIVIGIPSPQRELDADGLTEE